MNELERLIAELKATAEFVFWLTVLLLVVVVIVEGVK